MFLLLLSDFRFDDLLPPQRRVLVDLDGDRGLLVDAVDVQNDFDWRRRVVGEVRRQRRQVPGKSDRSKPRERRVVV